MSAGPQIEHREEADRTGSNEVWPHVTVIVPVHGDRGELRRTTLALAGQDYPGVLDVVVVDNGDNTDLEGSAAVLPSVQLLSEARPGSYAARNAALAAAGGEVLAFTDGDCLPDPGWLRAGVGALLSTPEPCFVGGAVHLFAQDPERPSLAEMWDSLNFLRQEAYVREQGWAATANMMTLRSTFDRVGPFEDRLRSGGDREWGERASRQGVRAVYCPAAVVRHPARARMAELHTKARRVSRGDVETRRRQGMPMFDPGVVRASLNPSPRSTVRRSADLSHPSPGNRARYVAVALWMRYYTFGSKLAYVVRTRGTSRQP
ncbi:glycosyltransferase family 2 protein [Kineococcus sp. SYSU DK002]|uniref:glycosyltransferase n=1 Tax=Kineococcus sp. SYSU DK002 TaxID=3383123 RepID=UPI003D7E62F2